MCESDHPLSSYSIDKSRQDGLCCYCKECRKKKARAQYLKHGETIRQKSQEHRKENLSYYAGYNKKYYTKNSKEIKLKVKAYREKNKESVAACKIKWARENAGRMQEHRKKSEQKNPIIYKARRRMKDMLRRTLKMSASKKTSGVVLSLGYTPEELKSHLESRFLTGMSWSNYGEWHIDHIKPIIAFIKSGCFDPLIINALENLTPLWAKDNMSKGAKWTSP